MVPGTMGTTSPHGCRNRAWLQAKAVVRLAPVDGTTWGQGRALKAELARLQLMPRVVFCGEDDSLGSVMGLRENGRAKPAAVRAGAGKEAQN